ncbi:thiol-activated cytolysin family protein [Chryseobacterium potabilaquae]|uniref:Thiol-activated cytolysin n=1 Tax=Chryseobacterium potabilaquae TaxID=2675057 RepID=A0A6N4X6T8_9FLAO|nr:thiol-activated cytolysin family protein [Chryseobacterium potabilaquae]CAA7196674.1 hypothetical protein CHRY9293_02750 [Chryseobacterium potabilaquae]
MKLKCLLVAAFTSLLCSCNDDYIVENTKNSNSRQKHNNIVKFEKNELIRGPKENIYLNTFGRRSKRGSNSCQEVRESLKKFFKSFSTLQPSNEVWPGSIVYKKSIMEGDLKPIIVSSQKRNKIEVKLNGLLVPTSTTQKSYRIVNNPRSTTVQEAIGDILADYFASGTSFPANYTVEIQRVSSTRSLEAGLDIGYTGATGIGAGAAFNLSFDINKTYYAVTLKQEFFTAQVSPLNLQGEEGWYTQDVSASTIQNSAYITAVSYGRVYTLLYESNEEGKKVEEALKFAYQTPLSNITASQKMAYASTLKNSNIKIKQSGGDAKLGIDVASDPEKIHAFLEKGADVSRNNMPAIIEYKANDTQTHESITYTIDTDVKYKECNDNEYSLVLKNVDYSVLPIIFRTEDNPNHSTYYLASGELIKLSYNSNLMQFTYKGSPIKEMDLNGGDAADDIIFEEKDHTYHNKYPYIAYRSQRIGYGVRTKLFDNYKDIQSTIAKSAEDKDGINGGVKAQLVGKKDLTKNELIIEIRQNQY